MSEYIRDPKTGQLRRVIYVRRGDTAPLARQSHAPLVVAPHYAHPPARRGGCSALALVLGLLLLLILAAALLAAWRIEPTSAAGQVGGQLANGIVGLIQPIDSAPTPDAPPAPTPADLIPLPPGEVASDLVVVEGAGYEYLAAPTVSRGTFVAILAEADSPMLGEAEAIYGVLVGGGIDPALWLAHVRKEVSYGHAGTGRPWTGDDGAGLNNPGGVRCTTSGRQRHCTSYRMGVYPSYTVAVEDWVWLLTTQGLYVDAGLTTIDAVVRRYAPPSENDTEQYIRDMHRFVDEVRARERAEGTSALPQGVSRIIHPAPPRGAVVTGEITARYNDRASDPNHPWCQINGCQHGGLDIGGASGTPVYLPITMRYVGGASESPYGGGYVIFHDSEGREWYFGHLVIAALTQDQWYGAGTQIGITQALNHVHIQLKVHGQLADPEPFLREWGVL